MNININAIIEFIISISTLLLCLKIYFFNRRYLSLNIFLLLLVFFSLWVFNLGLINTLIDASTEVYKLNLLIKLSYYMGTITSSLLIIFSYTYPEKNRIDLKSILFFLIIEIIFFYLIIFTDYIIYDSLIVGSGYIEWKFGYIWYLFDTYYITAFIYSIVILIRKYKDKSLDIKIRNSILHVSISLSLTIITLLITNIILPRFNVFNYEWIGLLISPISIYMIIYTILKYNFLKIKIYLLEILTLLLISFNIVFILLNNNIMSAYLYKITSFVSIVILGLLLINSIRSEKNQRDFIEKISNRIIKE